MTFDPRQAVSRLAERLNAPDLAFDEADQCVLATEAFEVYLDLAAERDSLFVYAKIGELPEAVPVELYRMLLEANFLTRETAGCTIGADERSGVILLSTRWSLRELDDESFEPRLLDFCEATDFWVQRIEAILDPNPQPLGDEPPAPSGWAGFEPGSVIRG